MLKFEDLLARGLDVTLIVSGAVLASQIRFDDIAQRSFYAAFVAFSAAFALAMFPAFGVYQSWRGRSKAGLAGQIALAWLMVQGCALVLMFSLHRIDFVSRLWFAYWTALSGGALIAVRLFVHAVLAHMRHAGLNLHQIAVVGCGPHGDAIARKIGAAPASGFRLAAAFNLDVGGTHGVHAVSAAAVRAELAESEKSRVREVTPALAGVPMFDDLSEFAAFVRTHGVHELWLALPLSHERLILDLVAEFRNDLVNIRFMPDVRSVALFDGGMIDLLGVPAINLIASPLSPHALTQKELFDRLFAAVVLIALAPALIAIALAIKLSSRGPVLFKQKRKGACGRVFTIYKFRSMRVHTEKPGTVRQATRKDARITRVGAFLRRTSLDELPQFFNVLRGDMSVVGPRPHALEHDDLYRKVVAGYIDRYRIKPGITGWAQINGFRGETDRLEKMERRVEHDLYYLRNWSFALDMRIIAATIFKGFVHSNAY